MPGINRSTVTLRFFGKSVDPERYTLLLGCDPTTAARTGETITTNSGKQRIIKRGFWILEYGDPDAVDFETKVTSLLAKLTADEDVWQQLTQGCQADLFCGLFLDGWNRGLGLSPALMREIGKRHLELNLDVYSPVNIWDEDRQDDHIDEAQP